MARTRSPFAADAAKLRQEINGYRKELSGAGGQEAEHYGATAQAESRRQFLQDLIQAKERMVARYARLAGVRAPARRGRLPGRAARAAVPARRARRGRVSRMPTPASVEVTSQRFAALPVVDAAEQVLKAAGRPVHLSEIVTQIMAGGKVIRAAHPNISVRHMIARDKRFRKAGKNIWTLA